MKSRAIIYILAAVAILVGSALILAAKLPAGPLATPLPTASPTLTPTSQPASTRTQTLPPTITSSVTRTPSPSTTRTATPTSPFASIADLVSIPSGAIHDLWISPQGDLWAAAGNGLYRRTQQGRYQRISDLAFSRILGTDNASRLWAITLGGASILSYDGNDWKLYGTSQGWTPVQPATVQRSLAVDAQGQLWLATGADDLRHFDPAAGRWESLDAVGIGFAPADPDYQGHYLTEAIAASDGSVWVADCIGMGEGFAGQGVRSFEAGTWQAIEATAGECVSDMERDRQGRMWVGAFDRMLRYDPIGGSWTGIALPAWDRRQIVTGIDLDPAGNPWVGILRCGGAACDTLAFYFRKATTWTPFLDEAASYLNAPGLAFSPDGTAWICNQGSVYRRGAPGTVEPVGSLQIGTCQVTVDGTGAVWVASSSGPAAGLWQVKP